MLLLVLKKAKITYVKYFSLDGKGAMRIMKPATNLCHSEQFLNGAAIRKNPPTECRY